MSIIKDFEKLYGTSTKQNLRKKAIIYTRV